MHFALRWAEKARKCITVLHLFSPPLLLVLWNPKGRFLKISPSPAPPFLLKLNIQVSSPSQHVRAGKLMVSRVANKNLINWNGRDFFLIAFKPIRWQQKTCVSLQTLKRQSWLLSTGPHCSISNSLEALHPQPMDHTKKPSHKEKVNQQQL